jgi:hypothetical protein
MKKMKKMDVLELANELDIMFGNPLGPKRYDLVKEAVNILRLQDEEIKALRNDVMELTKAQKK